MHRRCICTIIIYSSHTHRNYTLSSHTATPSVDGIVIAMCMCMYVCRRVNCVCTSDILVCVGWFGCNNLAVCAYIWCEKLTHDATRRLIDVYIWYSSSSSSSRNIQQQQQQHQQHDTLPGISLPLAGLRLRRYHITHSGGHSIETTWYLFRCGRIWRL